jgi:hypothetical protein
MDEWQLMDVDGRTSMDGCRWTEGARWMELDGQTLMDVEQN